MLLTNQNNLCKCQIHFPGSLFKVTRFTAARLLITPVMCGWCLFFSLNATTHLSLWELRALRRLWQRSCLGVSDSCRTETSEKKSKPCSRSRQRTPTAYDNFLLQPLTAVMLIWEINWCSNVAGRGKKLLSVVTEWRKHFKNVTWSWKEKSQKYAEKAQFIYSLNYSHKINLWFCILASDTSVVVFNLWIYYWWYFHIYFRSRSNKCQKFY